MNINPITDTVRLYVREWVIVHTITMSANDAITVLTAAQEWAKNHLDGRIPDNHINYEINTDGRLLYWCHIRVFKENLKGEFRYVTNAESFAVLKGYEEYTVVRRNSPEDNDIRNYGVIKL